MPEIEIFIFRHGETDWNREQRIQGHTDIPLNQNGRQQAQRLTGLLRDCSVQTVVTSDLSRATETAEIANLEIKVPIFISPELRECQLGDLEGMRRSDAIELFGLEYWDSWLSVRPEDQNFGFLNGETKSEHLQRLVKCIEDFCGKNEFERIAVSTHGGSLRRLVHYCTNSPAEPIGIPNCVLYKIIYNTETRAWVFHGEVN